MAFDLTLFLSRVFNFFNDFNQLIGSGGAPKKKKKKSVDAPRKKYGDNFHWMRTWLCISTIEYG